MLDQHDYILLGISQRETTLILDALSQLPLKQVYPLFQRILAEDQKARHIISQAMRKVDEQEGTESEIDGSGEPSYGGTT